VDGDFLWVGHGRLLQHPLDLLLDLLHVLRGVDPNP
jgi:hypothetical protein